MAKDTFWFKHDYDAADDEKTMILIEQLGLEGYGIYWVLIEKLRAREGYKMPFSIVPSLARRYMTTPEKMKTVIMNYGLFQYDDEGFFYSESLIIRMDALDEIKKKRAIAGRLGGIKSRKNIACLEQEEDKCQANAYQMPSKCLPNAKQKPSYKNRIDKSIEDKNIEEYKEKEEEINSSSKKKNKFDFKKAIIELGVEEQVAIDWIEVRKNKGASQTQTAFNRIKNEIERSGATANECITMAVEHSWQGFKSEWFFKERSQNTDLFSTIAQIENEQVIINGQIYR